MKSVSGTCESITFRWAAFQRGKKSSLEQAPENGSWKGTELSKEQMDWRNWRSLEEKGFNDTHQRLVAWIDYQRLLTDGYLYLHVHTHINIDMDIYPGGEREILKAVKEEKDIYRKKNIWISMHYSLETGDSRTFVFSECWMKRTVRPQKSVLKISGERRNWGSVIKVLVASLKTWAHGGKPGYRQNLVVHTSNPYTGDVEAGGSLRPAWSI